ncbi:Transposase [Oopsacas minuta]|uniref:Transposase n=1 Tax=Oopsacas minuta TaxID=111878 RepID=A0AAV7KDZ1_9METZ|nr:Transposase [Oopsacas minuta]
MSREFCVNHETMRKLVVEDLGMKSYKRKNVHHLNDSIRRKRLERCIQLKARFAPGTEDQILFSDEKLFTVEEASNRQNDVYLLLEVRISQIASSTLIESRSLFF